MDFDRDRFHAGDNSFFEELVSTYSPRLIPHLRRYSRDESDAHDLLQEVWLRVYNKRATFDGRGSLFGWLLMVVRTVGLTSVRKRVDEPAVTELPEIAVERDPDAPFLRETLREAVLTLPDRQRDVVILRLVEGLSTAEAARRLQCAEGTVKASMHQATKKLREFLKETVR